MGKTIPETLLVGVVTMDLAMLTYTTLFATNLWGDTLPCHFIRNIVDLNFDSHFLVHKVGILFNICITFLGWLGATLITIYTSRRVIYKHASFYDPYETAPMTPCLAIVTSILLATTMGIQGKFVPEPCSILMGLVVIFLFISGVALMLYFRVKKNRSMMEYSHGYDDGDEGGSDVSANFHTQAMRLQRLQLHRQEKLDRQRMRGEVGHQIKELEHLRKEHEQRMSKKPSNTSPTPHRSTTPMSYRDGTSTHLR